MACYAPFHPTRWYVNMFLFDMWKHHDFVRVVRKSQPLLPFMVKPENEPPTFEHFRNRLKILAGLDPVSYPLPKQGEVKLVIQSEWDGNEVDAPEHDVNVVVLFHDLAPDPRVELRMTVVGVHTLREELIRQGYDLGE